MKTIEIPELALVALIGASGSGKSTLARRHFLPTEVLSSDFFRGLVSDDENDQASTQDAFDALYYMLEKRLTRGKLTVVDATNVRAEDRKRLVEHARKYHCFAVAVVVNTPEKICQERNSKRPDRDFGPHVIRRQITDLKRGLRGLEQWWEELTGKGGEGMVVKPLDFIARGPKGLLQPAIKCRGREYLRIIYGPEYTADDQLPRLRARGLSGKRSLAAREFALGIEALERFVAREPLRRVHECVFGVLALESEPMDPRL